MAWPEPLTLTGPHASLRPLGMEHHDALCEAARDGELWRLWYTAVPSPQGMAAEIERRLALHAAGAMLPFTLFDAAGRVVGMSTFMNIDARNRRLEIGSTWIAESAQRGPVNTQCKRLLLGHAFEGLDCIAVELRTHRLNSQSRRAIERLGAQLDGLLRSHAIAPDGSIRDTAVYSITAAEWPAVRSHLDWQLLRPRAP
jgi:RimJ/RimL family protein N-acetyltransferase